MILGNKSKALLETILFPGNSLKYINIKQLNKQISNIK